MMLARKMSRCNFLAFLHCWRLPEVKLKVRKKLEKAISVDTKVEKVYGLFFICCRRRSIVFLRRCHEFIKVGLLTF